MVKDWYLTSSHLSSSTFISVVLFCKSNKGSIFKKFLNKHTHVLLLVMFNIAKNYNSMQLVTNRVIYIATRNDMNKM